ncbi:unnamed protein product [Rotaria magnacalcarata]|uniref:DUF6570 domain-containing protein n=1 Tax=Rotaria magnacalcarata TaxID=392030 RepID=A0A816MB54_9BILA|nr:unnamed protein product [Rotaria magnacalcarata]CAF1578338.1 unnamed protein product [Rotaria magnacalcarata]CAF1987166.1 unnamed protein product [Rotaria magnacalcarata]CAF2128068.1 unnamed protein product [Rotaria magnacalcarata]CAF4146783.1 unnamed protein product [Rotaria magnacalcarata]
MLNKIPTPCLSNGLAFYEIPDCLKILTELEERLISPRIPFMVIRSLGSYKQFGLKGNLVNVPMNVDTNVSILPRSFSDTHTIQLKLMRQVKNKNAFILECLWEILFAPCGSFEGNELEDKYIRVEFQVRGSPHIHVLIWLKNAPKYDKNKPKSIEQCIAFLDKLISVNAKPTEFSEELINLQRHKHSHTCKKHVKNGIKCRFGIPYFPMKKAMILEPFTDDEKFTKKRK